MYLRISGAVAIAVGLLQAYFISFAISFAREYGPDASDWYVVVPGAVTAAAFVGAGVASQFRISVIPLAAAWGWLLGMTVPRLLERALLPFPQIPAEFLRRDVIFRIFPDYTLECGLIVAAVAGIVLCYLADRNGQSFKG
jgi:hypothetical protein